MFNLVMLTIYSYVAVLPFDSILVMSGDESGATYNRLIMMMALLAIYLYITANRIPLVVNRALSTSLAFIVFAVLSVLWSVDVDMALARVPIALSLFIFYYAISTLPMEQKQYDLIVTILVTASTLATLYILKIYFTEGISYSIERASLIYGDHETDPNQLAFSILLPLSLAIETVFISASKVRKILYASSSVILAAGIASTGSRGGMLGVLAILLVFILFTYSLKRALIVAGVAVVTGFGFWESIASRFEIAASTGGAGRLDIWEVGVSAFLHSPIYGYGVSNFPAAYDLFRYVNPLRGAGRGAHNIFLGMAVELGVIGLVLATLLLVYHFKLLSHVKSRALPLKAAFCGMLVQATTLDIWWRKSFWILLILINVAYFTEARCAKSE